MTTKGVGAWRVPKAYILGMTIPTEQRDLDRIHWTIIGIQNDLIRRKYLAKPSYPLDGVIGPKTDAAIKAFQKDEGLKPDGSFGPKTSLAFFSPFFVLWQSALNIPNNNLMGLCRLESVMDPGAEGYIDQNDCGITQINLPSHPDISREVAYSQPGFCIQRAAATYQDTYNKLKSHDATIASWNSPVKGRKWASLGYAPDEQIQKYVDLVKQNAALPY